MLALPDYIVLNFLEWISQSYPRNKGLLDSLLNDKGFSYSFSDGKIESNMIKNIYYD